MIECDNCEAHFELYKLITIIAIRRGVATSVYLCDDCWNLGDQSVGEIIEAMADTDLGYNHEA